MCTKCCDDCSSETFCPPNLGDCLQLDSSSVFYHKDNNEISELTNLGVENGASLELILEAIDSKLGQLSFEDFTLASLDGLGYTVDNLRQFAEAVDTEIGVLHGLIEDFDPGDVMQVWLGNLSSDPGAATDGTYWFNTSSNLLKMKVNGGLIKTITTS